jgi:uncharacterized membrane protein HdeD (DUF308 family)
MNDLSNAVNRGGASVSVFGVITIILGILCMLAPGITGLSIALFVGILVLIGGIVRLIWAFRAGSLGRGLLTFAIGALTIICGIMLVSDPLLASGFLTVMMAVYFILDGVSEIAAGNKLRPQTGSGWLIFGGILSVLLDIMIWRQFPLSGDWAIGVLLGIKLFSVGLIMVTGGSMVRAAVKKVDSFAK